MLSGYILFINSFEIFFSARKGRDALEKDTKEEPSSLHPPPYSAVG